MKYVKLFLFKVTMTSTLPNNDELLSMVYDFNAEQEEILDIIYKSLENIINELDTEDGYLSFITYFIIKYYINLFTRNNNSYIVVYSRVGNHTFYRITNKDTLIQILTDHITFNIRQYGIFTEYWSPIEPNLILYTEPVDDTILVEIANDDTNTDVDYEAVDRLFESNRQDVVNKTFSCDKNHNINISDSIVERNENNNECKLCYDTSKYICTKCNYSICESCMDKLKHSTGKCPCCQLYPLELSVIKDIIENKVDDDTKNESNDTAIIESE